MRRLLYLLTISFASNFCFSQTAIFGLYEQHGLGGYFTMDLKPNHVCIKHMTPFCGLVKNKPDTTTWTGTGDTIVIETDNQYFKTFLFRSNQLFHLNYSDSIVSTENGGKLSDHYYLSYPPLDRIGEYYDNGSVLSETKKYNKKKMETLFYPDGKLKELRQYTNDKKSGDWYTFDNFGNITSVTTYKNGKKRKT